MHDATTPGFQTQINGMLLSTARNLNRIQWLSAAQDGSYDTAHAALLEIEDLAAEALGREIDRLPR